MPQPRLLRLGVEPRTVLSKLLLEPLVSNTVLRGDLRRRPAADPLANATCLDHCGGHALVLDEPCGADADDTAANDPDIHVEFARKLREGRRRTGIDPIDRRMLLRHGLSPR